MRAHEEVADPVDLIPGTDEPVLNNLPILVSAGRRSDFRGANYSDERVPFKVAYIIGQYRRALDSGGPHLAEKLLPYKLFRMNSAPQQPVTYQLRIILRTVSPLIWRRLLVPSNTDLAHLHRILQILFSWDEEHLHRFHIHGKAFHHFGGTKRWKRSPSNALPFDAETTPGGQGIL